jgi:hypothetical protein
LWHLRTSGISSLYCLPLISLNLTWH